MHSLFAVFYLKNSNTKIKQFCMHIHKYATSMDICNSLQKSCTSRVQSIIWGVSQSSFQSCTDIFPIGQAFTKNAIGGDILTEQWKTEKILEALYGYRILWGTSRHPLKVVCTQRTSVCIFYSNLCLYGGVTGRTLKSLDPQRMAFLKERLEVLSVAFWRTPVVPQVSFHEYIVHSCNFCIIL